MRKLRYSHFKKSLIASCYDSGVVCLWDANKRQLMNSFSSHMAPVMDLAFSPLNEMLLMSVGLDKRIVCYDVQGKRYHISYSIKIFVSLDESRGYFGFSTVTPPPQRFPFGRDNLKNILVRPFKFGMWLYMGNAMNAIVL